MQHLAGQTSIADDALHGAVENLARVAQTPTQLIVVAAALGEFGQPERGLTFAKRAEKLSPIDYRVLDVTAALVAALGRVDEAVRIQRQAVAFVPENANAPEVLEHLRRYESRSERITDTH